MEVSLQLQRPLRYKPLLDHKTDCFKINSSPFATTLLFTPWRSECLARSVSHRVIAGAADFSKRRRRRLSSRSSPKGFTPKTQAGTSDKNRDQKNGGDDDDEEEDSSITTLREPAEPTKTEIESKVDEESTVELSWKNKVDEGEKEEPKEDVTSTGKELAVSEINLNAESGNVSKIVEDVTGLHKKEVILENNTPSTSKDLTSEGKQLDGTITGDTIAEEKDLDGMITDDTVIKGNQLDGMITEDTVTEGKHIDDTKIDDNVIVKDESIEPNEKIIEDVSAKLKLEMEENLRKQEIEVIAEENFLKGNKIFVYPQFVKPEGDIEVFFNRSLSPLNDEPDILIMGAFNNWRWRSVTKRLNKTHLKADWWSCQIHVPKEAYKMDFVFFNGQNLYDNNDKKDFCITVEGGMDEFAFEDFLLEEKRRELEKLAKEQEEKKRQEEEQVRIEAEKAAKEADRAHAKVETKKRREILEQLMKRAARSVDNAWFIKTDNFKGADKVKLYYNKTSGPLAHAIELWIHGGRNNWSDGLTIVEKLVRSEKEGGDWWYAEVVIPDRALVLDWVFADGPPKVATIYDNNNHQDFRAVVPKNIPEELFWVEEEHHIFRKLQAERKLREEAILAKAEKTARLKAEMKERTLKRFLLSQKHIVYTEPLDVHAGSTVTVFYNPANTILSGKQEVWFRCSFNRWTHRMGLLPPKRMLPADNSSHAKAIVKVPLDAYMMDFVFSEREDGGIFDNKDGMDYHIPVLGGIVKEPPMHIVHIAVEMAPIAKVGGLGDVVTSLSRAVQDLNHNVNIILPKYDCLNLSHVKDLHYQKSYFWGDTEIKVWFGEVESLSVYFLEPQNGFVWKGCVYGCNNDAERFGFFCHAALEFLHQGGLQPDIIHCHDWSSAPVAWLFKDHYMHYGLSKTRVVFTIHNLEFGAHFIAKAMQYADKATTVSHTYAKEVTGNPAVSPNLHKFHGILNGIDLDMWDPYNNKFLPIPYTSENVVEGKRVAKEALQQRLGLKKSDLPVVGIISRLTHQKGIHLIKHAIWHTLESNGQVVLLGSAPDPRIQNDFVNLANQLHSTHGDRARLVLTYDEPLSHLIYAGADFILVPSIFEPCGLTQLTAMRYGSIPVVRKTGGLYDTVFDVDNDKARAEAQGLEPNGFNFDGADSGGVDYALNRAISAWYDGRDWFYSLCKRVMEQDWSWNRPALDYMELYHAAKKY
ncbi:starch synthase 3, chloroplastic/amyloplastic-like [Hibiscus syriacus]|uniref:starch synthase 3, chloroplastic/amyloplastic-like n=1 Tax=Hibiscus syriacus TaxID=106335 RepID=UPI0019239CE9|nr:starch synthase 3, chloroplastic/amyloplastic-like [Hibiscus syriacus]